MRDVAIQLIVLWWLQSTLSYTIRQYIQLTVPHFSTTFNKLWVKYTILFKYYHFFHTRRLYHITDFCELSAHKRRADNTQIINLQIIGSILYVNLSFYTK